jgi:magnesium chelatase family protein
VLAQVYSSAIFGIDAYTMEIEVDFSPARERTVVIVGLPDAAVKESKDRVFTAIKNSGFVPPQGYVTINLAPADIKKEGPSFDLPIALGLLAATGQIRNATFKDSVIVGELALNGAVRPVKGVLPVAVAARDKGKRGIVVPADNAAEASVVDGIDAYPVQDLVQAAKFVNGELPIEPVKRNLREAFEEEANYPTDLSDVKGQEHVKRALEVAVAGSHNILMLGPPGAGKTMLAKCIPTIIPEMSLEEALETTKIHSIVGLLTAKNYLVAIRPFRSPHHTVSYAGLIGGGTVPKPGEVSLAHNGVLFLDELPEFNRNVLEVLRQPLEEGSVTIVRATGSLTFPASFMLAAAMNPCPCGYFTDPRRECRCTPSQIHRYISRISGPLIDRVDIHVDVPALRYKELAEEYSGETSAQVRQRVNEARKVQRERFKGHRIFCNGAMTSRHIKKFCQLDGEGREVLKMAINELGISARAYDRILKVSRTIADLEHSQDIKANHISEAIQYRTLDRSLWL